MIEMATILDALKGISAYPIPPRTLVEVAEGRGISLSEEATQAVITGRLYRLAKADLLLWLFLAPNVGQGGQSYSFTDEQRKQFRNQANAIYAELGDVRAAAQPTYGYKGSRL